MRFHDKLKRSFTLVLVALLWTAIAQATSITRSDAISIAMQVVNESFHIDLENNDEYSLAECVKQEKKGGPEWFILFSGEPNERYATNTYAIYLKDDGTVRWLVPPTLVKSLNDEFNAMIREKGSFVTWSYEEKYYFRNEWYIRVADWEEQHHEGEEAISGYLAYLIDRPYALPQPDDVSPEDAEFIARNALKLDDDKLATYKVAFSFLEDPELGRVWTVYYLPTSREMNLSPYYRPDRGFKVIVDAQDGYVIEAVNQNESQSYWSIYYE